jgi:hypothetical protein
MENWRGEELVDKIKLTLMERMEIATEYLLSRVVSNISRPVTKKKGVRSKRIQVTNRSKPGEFPKADTTQLMKTTFKDVQEESPGVVVGYIGTPLDYGVILEVSESLDRKWLTRTLEEEKDTLVEMLTGPIE